jgi:hypothetical protein
MGMLDWLFPPITKDDGKPETVSLADVLDTYDLVEVVTPDDPSIAPFAIVTERAAGVKTLSTNVVDPAVDMRELGTSSPSPFLSFSRREYNRELQGLMGLQKYDRMRKSDGTVRGTLRLYKTPVLAGRWFVEAATDKKADQNAADFVWKCLTEYQSISFTQILSESLLSADFGYYMFEKVWEERVIDGKTRMIWSKLAPRHPMDVKEWKYDSHGGPKAAIFYPSTMNGSFTDDDVPIPIDKLLVFTHDREAGNIEGVSVLRSAYKHWYFKEQLYKIDAIQKERHGIGIPIIKLPAGFTSTDKNAANELGRNLRTNERAHVVLPPNWDLMFAKLEGHVVDALKSVEVHDDAIRENILGGFLKSGQATKEEDQTMFLKATRFMADMVCDTFNLYGIPQLIDYNFDRVTAPKLRVRRIGEQADWRTISFAVRNLIGAGVIRPDDELEKHLREEMDLPKADITTVRVVSTPQAAPGQPSTLPNATPGTAAPGTTPQQAPAGQNTNTNTNTPGMPRQSPTPPVGLPSAGAGRDGSGGK